MGCGNLPKQHKSNANPRTVSDRTPSKMADKMETIKLPRPMRLAAAFLVDNLVEEFSLSDDDFDYVHAAVMAVRKFVKQPTHDILKIP